MATLEARLASFISALGPDIKALQTALAGLTDASIAPVAPNAQTGTTYTSVMNDKHRVVTLSNASSITATIPTNASVAYPLGTILQWVWLGAGQPTIAGPSGGTLRAPRGAKIAVQYGMASALKIDTDTWVLSGDVTT